MDQPYLERAGEAGLASLGCPPRFFFENVYGRPQHSLFKADKRHSLNQLVTWSDVDQLLNHVPLRSPRLRIVANGATVSETEYLRVRHGQLGETYPRILPGPLANYMSAGATLVINGVDELLPRVQRLATSLERDLGERVEVNLFATWGVESAFGEHVDDHDVLAVQAVGQKAWRVSGQPLLLEQGDVLYLSRGTPHHVAAVGVGSIHLAIAYRSADANDFYKWADQAGMSPPLLDDPLPPPGQILASPEATRRHAELAAFYRSRNMSDPGRGRIDLVRLQGVPVGRPFAVEDTVVLAVPRSPEARLQELNAGELASAACLEYVVGELVRRLQVRVADLYTSTAYSAAQIDDALVILFKDGWVYSLKAQP